VLADLLSVRAAASIRLRSSTPHADGRACPLGNTATGSWARTPLGVKCWPHASDRRARLAASALGSIKAAIKPTWPTSRTRRAPAARSARECFSRNSAESYRGCISTSPARRTSETDLVVMRAGAGPASRGTFRRIRKRGARAEQRPPSLAGVPVGSWCGGRLARHGGGAAGGGGGDTSGKDRQPRIRESPAAHGAGAAKTESRMRRCRSSPASVAPAPPPAAPRRAVQDGPDQEAEAGTPPPTTRRALLSSSPSCEFGRKSPPGRRSEPLGMTTRSVRCTPCRRCRDAPTG